MERLVDLHIKEGPIKDYPLNAMQHAYLKGKSIETVLHDLRKNLPWAFDVEGPFDNTSSESMDETASDHGVCSTIIRWIDFMLRSRSVFVDIRGVRVHILLGCDSVVHRVYYRPYYGI
jgi:hypothetical protein